jgi:hypothetical protein
VTSIFLLPVSAAAGLVIVKILRWRHRRGHMPPRSALQREAAYASILARPTFERVAAWAAIGVLLWICAEGFLLLAPSSLPKKMKFDKALEHVVVETVVNFAQEVEESNQQNKNRETLQNSPCQRLLWTVDDIKVEADVTVERCWTAYPLDAQLRNDFNLLREVSFSNITEATTILWALQPTNSVSIELLVLFKGFDDPIALVAYTTAWVSGTNLHRFVRWPNKGKPQVWQMVPFYERIFDALGCEELVPSATVSDSSPTGDFDAVSVSRTCSNASSADIMFGPLPQVLLDHVDLQVVDREGGFAASFTTDEDTAPKESPLYSNKITIGEIEVPRVNIVSSAIAGGIAVIVFIVASRIPDFDATEAVLEHYDVLKAVYEKTEVKVVDNNVDADVEAKGGEVDN